MADKILRETVMKDDKGNEAKVYIGVNPEIYGLNSLRIGEGNTAIEGSVANGKTCSALGNNSHAEGYNTVASGEESHAEGYFTTAIGKYSHAEGHNTNAEGAHSHAEGSNTIASVMYSHAEGHNTITEGLYSHAEGYKTTANAMYSHAEGDHTITEGLYSHAEGYYTTASAMRSHAEGYHTVASGNYSHAEGYYTTAQGENQLVIGRCNNPNTSDLFQVGCGASSNRKQNAFSIDNEGKTHIYKGLILEDVDISSNNSVLKLNPSNGENIILGNNSLVVNNATEGNRGHISIYDNIYFKNLETPTILGMYDTSFSLPAFPETITIKANSNIDAYGDFSSAFISSSKTAIDMKNWITSFHTNCANFLEEYNIYKNDKVVEKAGVNPGHVSCKILLKGFNRMCPRGALSMSTPSTATEYLTSFKITGPGPVYLFSDIKTTKDKLYPQLRFKILQDASGSVTPSVSVTIMLFCKYES